MTVEGNHTSLYLLGIYHTGTDVESYSKSLGVLWVAAFDFTTMTRRAMILVPLCASLSLDPCINFPLCC